jgi:predicted Zn-dependent protease
LQPGDYTVILEEYAVADMLAFLGFLGFSAQAVHEGRSFMKLGEQVVGDNVTIWDDGLDSSGLPMPFDFEGVPKSRLTLIEKGIARAVVHDSYTAGKEGKTSTGHALPAPNTMGPLPLNMFMATGEHSKEEMLASTKKGIWVTRFNYTRPVHPLKVVVTGTTRDGTFLIENGELAKPIKNLRFTQSYLDALSRVEMLGNSARLVTGFLGSSCVPALKIGAFTFTGATQF